MKPLEAMTPLTDSQFGRFAAKFDMGDECWEWTGCVASNGYGRFQHDGNSRLAHRISYAEFVGELDPELMLDHICKNRKCVRPGHLEQVTAKTNVNRGISHLTNGAAVNRAKQLCKQGHPIDDENENTFHYLSRGAICRGCKTCRRASSRAYEARNKGMKSST